MKIFERNHVDFNSGEVSGRNVAALSVQRPLSFVVHLSATNLCARFSSAEHFFHPSIYNGKREMFAGA